MAVRFLPAPEEREPGRGEARADLAEVIELRGALKQQAWGESRASVWDRRPAAEAWSQADDDRGQVPEPVAELKRAVADLVDAGTAVAGGTESEAGSRSGAGRERSRTRRPSVGRKPSANRDASAVRDTSVEDAASDREDGPTRSSYEDGVRLLGRRARSSGELREELLRLGHDSAEVEAVIGEFERSLYLDDLALARRVTEKLRESKRSSRSQIRVKLIGRRLPDAAIEAALSELDADEEFELLREAAVDRARKLGGLDRQTAERRLLGFLARRGWSGEPAMRAVRAALDGTSKPSGGVRFS